ncbi:MAG TPA: DUF1015 domain-containing protein [Streptosporangiaceae bacterium]|nr:DUF1015 domain-containing protein [Streptosporangiaceae bacterium]
MQTLPSDSGSGLVLAPFRGIRYARDRVSGIANVTSPPYDVISGGILENLRAADPHNVVRLILPGEDADASQAAARLLREWLSAGVLIRDRMPALYLYEQADEASSWLQRGIISLVRLGSPETAGILPHEGVMPGLVADRKALMAATRANLEPIFLIYDREGAGTRPDEAAPTATEIIDHVAAEHTPIVSITTEDGVKHRLWRLGHPDEQDAILADLAGRRALIADGHHRYAAYLDLQADKRASGLGAGPWDYGLAFLVDSDAYPPRLGPIHRVLPGLPPERAAELAKAAFTVQDLPAGTGLARALECLAAAGREGTAFLLAGGPVEAAGFWLLSQPDPVQVAASMPAGASASWQRLDASVMQQLLIGRLWGITDSERDVLINHDAADAVRAATSTGATAVICNPPSFDAVIQIAAQGERVPRKSTSFGPKPRTGLVLRTFGPAS